MARRRHLEDSVVVSIDQVRDMIRGETKPVVKAAPVPIARAVPPEAVTGVPSFAEVAARRQQRWDSEPIGQAQVVRVAPRMRWRAPLLTAIVGALVAGGAVFAVHAAEGDPAPFTPALAAYDDAVDNAVLEAELRVANTNAEAARLKVASLEAQLADLEVALATARTKAEAVAEAAPPEETVTKRSKRATSRRSSKRASPRRASTRSAPKRVKRRPATKMTGNDKALDSLIDGL